MEYLKEYASNIVVISVLSTVFEIIMPEGKNKKYVKVVIGLVVMLVIMQPLKLITDIKGNFFEIPSFEIEKNDAFYETNLVADRFEEDLAAKIEETVNAQMSEKIECIVETGRNEKGEITGITKIKIMPYSKEISAFVCREVGVDESVIEGEGND